MTENQQQTGEPDGPQLLCQNLSLDYKKMPQTKRNFISNRVSTEIKKKKNPSFFPNRFQFVLIIKRETRWPPISAITTLSSPQNIKSDSELNMTYFLYNSIQTINHGINEVKIFTLLYSRNHTCPTKLEFTKWRSYIKILQTDTKETQAEFTGMAINYSYCWQLLQGLHNILEFCRNSLIFPSYFPFCLYSHILRFLPAGFFSHRFQLSYLIETLL